MRLLRCNKVYLLKFVANLEKYANKMHWFLHAAIYCNSLTNLLITYLLLQFVIPVILIFEIVYGFMQTCLNVISAL